MATKRDLAAQPKVNTSGESVYSQLNTLREAESQYQTLCMPTREAIVSDDVDKSKLAQTSFPDVLETGQVNEADGSGKVCDLSNDENKATMKVLHESNFNRHWCVLSRKSITAIGSMVLAVIVIILIFLLVPTQATGNTESYQELQRMTAKRPEEIAALKQLNNSMATSSNILTEHILLENQFNSSVLSLQTHSVQVSRAQDDTLDQRLQIMEQNLTSLRRQHEAEFSDVLSIIGNRIEKMDTSLMTLMDANTNIESTVNSLSSEYLLRTIVDNLNNEVNKLSLNNMALNSSLLHLTALSVPIGCGLNTYTRAVVNRTSASTPISQTVSDI